MIVKIDGIGLNAKHFAAMSEADAVKEMKDGNILKTHNKDEAWAKAAYAKCVEALKPKKEAAPKV